VNQIEQAVSGGQLFETKLAQVALSEFVVGAFVSGIGNFDDHFASEMPLDREFPLLVTRRLHFGGPGGTEGEADAGNGALGPADEKHEALRARSPAEIGWVDAVEGREPGGGALARSAGPAVGGGEFGYAAEDPIAGAGG